MKKFNWRIVNVAFWIEIVLSYVLPFKVVDNFRYKVGFPLRFITVYDADIGVNPLVSMHLNPVFLLMNVIIIYFIISICAKGYHELRKVLGGHKI